MDFTIETQPVQHRMDGKITVIEDPSVSVASIQIIAGPLMLPVVGNQFCNLMPGTYKVRVNHVGCPDAMPVEVLSLWNMTTTI